MRKSNPIGTGTANLSVNAPIDWVREIGRAAFASGLSLGEYVRRKLELGVETDCPDRAERLRQIRKQYYSAGFLILFSGALLASWRSHEDLQRTCRRCPRRPGCRFEECVTVEMEEI